jgi:hypothetical protein
MTVAHVLYGSDIAPSQDYSPGPLNPVRRITLSTFSIERASQNPIFAALPRMQEPPR